MRTRIITVGRKSVEQELLETRRIVRDGEKEIARLKKMVSSLTVETQRLKEELDDALRRNSEMIEYHSRELADREKSDADKKRTRKPAEYCYLDEWRGLTKLADEFDTYSDFSYQSVIGEK